MAINPPKMKEIRKAVRKLSLEQESAVCGGGGGGVGAKAHGHPLYTGVT